MEFFKARLNAQENGLSVWFDIYKPIHETSCFYFCVNALRLNQAKNIIKMNQDKNPVTAVRSSGFIKVVRISKSGSRIAQASKDDAIKNLTYRTQRRIDHMMRDIEFCKAFIKNNDNLTVDYESDSQLVMLVNGTKDLVHKHYNVFY